ncbi:protein toll-like [Mytilus galloprovincialis]|uniref:protein toll-like n=1 Tax=Mytilus galloprovincialis TaxID=29158 RepID=UPI003F7C1162
MFSSSHLSKINQESYPGYFHWRPHTVVSNFLMCPDACNHTITFRRNFAGNNVVTCCVKDAQPFWNISKSNLLDVLHLKTTREYWFFEGIDTSAVNLYFKVVYQQGDLKEIPDILCKSKKIVEINFSANQIENIANIDCLHILDTLNLSFNRVSSLKNTTFRVLKYLRVLNLSYNKIQYIEPNTFNYRPGSLMKINLNRNLMESIDVTNLLIDYWFDRIDLIGNRISKFTNELSNKFNFSNGGGTINLGHNLISEFPNLPKLGIPIDILLSGVFKYPINIFKNPIKCDCKFGSFIKTFQLAAKHFEGPRIFICKDPPLLREKRLIDINEDLLTCDISMQHRCPPECNCYEQPSRSRVVVNCSSTRKRKMPSVCPQQDDLDIDFSHNFISVFEYHTYLNRTFSINLSNNRITSVDPFIYGIVKLRNINLQHNKILQIHKNVLLMTNDHKISFGRISIKCSCEMKWIESWLENQLRRHGVYNSINCHIRGRNIQASSISEICAFVKPNSTVKYVLFSVVISIFVSLLLCLKMKYELCLLLRNFKRLYLNRFNNNDSVEPIRFDVYISFNAENSNIMKWIKTVVSNLEKNGYKICLPPRDFDVGGVHVDQISTEIANSISYLVILSDDYLKSQFQMIEWNKIWAHYKTNIYRNIVVINYDISDSVNIQDRKLKAFVRLGFTFDFCNFNNKLMNDIELKLRRTEKLQLLT